MPLCVLLLVGGAAAFSPLAPLQQRTALQPVLQIKPVGFRCGRLLIDMSEKAGERAGELVMSGGAAEPNDGREFTLYPQRWVQLAYLSLLALLSDWVCFSVAASPETWESAYQHDPATLIDIFLFTNVLFCLLEPGIVRRFGLRQVICGAGVTMVCGCLLRSGIPFIGTELQPYNLVVAGTVLVGAAQPFFQCTPPLLSAKWFGADERALATAIAINFNQVGIATAFLVGGAMAGSADGLLQYFSVISAASLVVTLGAFLQFQEKPLTPPTGSAAAKELVRPIRRTQTARKHSLHRTHTHTHDLRTQRPSSRYAPPRACCQRACRHACGFTKTCADVHTCAPAPSRARRLARTRTRQTFS